MRLTSEPKRPTSATLDAEIFSTYFFQSPIFTIPRGIIFPVEILYTKEAESDYLEAAMLTVLQIHWSEPAGDILVFLTCQQEEIDVCYEKLFNRMQALDKGGCKLLPGKGV